MAEEQAATPSIASTEANSEENTENLQENNEIKAESESSDEKAEIRPDSEIDKDKTLSKKEKAEEKRFNKIRLKYNGKEYDEELPFELPDTKEAREYMQKHLQMSKLSQNKSQEFATLEKEAIEFLKALKENPEEVLSDPRFGVDVKKLATKIIEREIANSQKTPEQLELEKAQNELKRLKAEREKEQEASKKREYERAQEQAYEYYEQQIAQALDTSELPKSPYTVKKMADYMMIGLKNGVELSAKDIVPLVKEEMYSDLKEMFAVMPEDVIENLVGKETINKIRKKNLAKAKEAPKVQTVEKTIKDTGTKTQKEAKQLAPKKSFKEFFGV